MNCCDVYCALTDWSAVPMMPSELTGVDGAIAYGRIVRTPEASLRTIGEAQTARMNPFETGRSG